MKINNPPRPAAAAPVTAGPTYVVPEIEPAKPEPPQIVEPKKVEQFYGVMPSDPVGKIEQQIKDEKQKELDAHERFKEARLRVSAASAKGDTPSIEAATKDMRAAESDESEAHNKARLLEWELEAAKQRIAREGPRRS